MKINSKRFLKILGLYIVAVVYAFSTSLSVYAIDKDFYSSNDILFYDSSESGADQECETGKVKISGKDNREKINRFLISKGLNAEQAAGVLGNIQHESGFSPTTQEIKYRPIAFEKGGYGIVQWTHGRRTSLAEHLKKTLPELYNLYYNSDYVWDVLEADGFVPRSKKTGELMPIVDNDALLLEELNFLYDETTSRKISSTTEAVTSAKKGDNEWEALKKSKDIEDASNIWLYNFEVPDKIKETAIERVASAKKIYEELSKSNAEPAECVNNTSGDIEALQGTVKLYAWPEYHKAPYVTKKPAYDKAVELALKSGGYVGGIKYRGVDCGGFVTRVMVDSGYEPDYNANKGATGTQKVWLDNNWEKLGIGSSIDTATLKPGDVAIKTGHTFMFAGTDIEGFGTTSGWKGVASASLDERAPMAGTESLTSPLITWYRKGAGVYE